MSTIPGEAPERVGSRAVRRVVVTGATGTVGREVAALLASEDSCRSVLLTRDPARAALTGNVARADFQDAAGLVGAFAGADAVLVITNDPLRPDHDANIVTAALAAGVGHLVKLSALAVTDPQAVDLVTSWQRTAEDGIRRSGIPWTFLRPRAYMSHALAWLPDILRDGTVRALNPASRNACVSPADIAHVALRALLEDGHHGRAYALTGPEPLSARDQTAQLAAVLGRPLRCVGLTVQQAQERWRRRYSEPMVSALTAGAERQRAGAKERTSGDVEMLLGRPPVSFSSWAGEHAPLFGPSE
ncbi:NAD(P)H-binding protein [Streptomyces sp. NPDC001770]